MFPLVHHCKIQSNLLEITGRHLLTPYICKYMMCVCCASQASHTHDAIAEAAQLMKEAVDDIMMTLNEAASEVGMVGGMVESIADAMAKVTHWMSDDAWVHGKQWRSQKLLPLQSHATDCFSPPAVAKHSGPDTVIYIFLSVPVPNIKIIPSVCFECVLPDQHPWKFPDESICEAYWPHTVPNGHYTVEMMIIQSQVQSKSVFSLTWAHWGHCSSESADTRPTQDSHSSPLSPLADWGPSARTSAHTRTHLNSFSFRLG